MPVTLARAHSHGLCQKPRRVPETLDIVPSFENHEAGPVATKTAMLPPSLARFKGSSWHQLENVVKHFGVIEDPEFE